MEESLIAFDGNFAYVKVNDVNAVGAFVDVGGSKELLVPFRHQLHKMAVGRSYIIAIINDEKSNRLIGSEKYLQYLSKDDCDLEINQEVDVLVVRFSDLGANVIINNKFVGLIYQNEIFERLFIGDKFKAYIKLIRENGKIDVSIQKLGADAISANSDYLLNKLEDNDGVIFLTDNSTPDEIYNQIGISKKLFKKAVGNLFKRKLILLEHNAIRLIETGATEN